MNAIITLLPRYPNLKLDVYGRGQAKSVIELSEKIERLGLKDRVTLKGAVANGTLPQTLKSYVAMLLPSTHETFGLVYTEALFAGVPVLYSTGRGIDGFFPPEKIGYACNPFNADEITNGLSYLIENEDKLKKSIQSMQEQGELNILRRDQILAAYRHQLDQAIANA